MLSKIKSIFTIKNCVLFLLWLTTSYVLAMYRIAVFHRVIWGNVFFVILGIIALWSLFFPNSIKQIISFLPINPKLGYLTYVTTFLAIITLGICTTQFTRHFTFSNQVIVKRGSKLDKQIFKDSAYSFSYSDWISKDEEEAPIVIFYKIGCIRCETSIPYINETFTAKQKKNIVFIDATSEAGNELFTKLNLEHYSTMIYRIDNTFGVDSLAYVDDSNTPHIRLVGMNHLSDLTER